jgi:HEAT repeat protein
LYHVHATREQGVLEKGTREVLANLKVESNFDVSVRSPQERELEIAYQPFLNDLLSSDLIVKYFAASAVTQNPPRFAEAAILALANDEPGASIGGLARLATPAARAKLREMSSINSPGSLREASIVALGDVGNSDDCEAMLGIASENEHYTQGEAYMASARICKEQAVPTLIRLLPAADDELENTHSRDAIPPLITLLSSGHMSVRRRAEQALATLTHRRSAHEIDDADSAREASTDWSSWWAHNSTTTNIYGPDACVEPQLLR